MASKIAEIWNEMTGLQAKIPKFGKPRPLASAETATSWREIKVGTETFRVLTMEEKND